MKIKISLIKIFYRYFCNTCIHCAWLFVIFGMKLVAEVTELLCLTYVKCKQRLELLIFFFILLFRREFSKSFTFDFWIFLYDVCSFNSQLYSLCKCCLKIYMFNWNELWIIPDQTTHTPSLILLYMFILFRKFRSLCTFLRILQSTKLWQFCLLAIS